MNQMFTCRPIPVNRIQQRQHWDLRPFLAQTAAVFQSPASIRRAGLLYLPLVRPTGEGLYEYLTGSRCVACAGVNRDVDEIACRVLGDGISDVEVLNLLYAEYSRHNPPTSIENAHFLRLCLMLLDEHEWRRLAADLQLAVSPYGVARLQELLRLEPVLQEWLWDGRLTESMARELLKLSKEDRAALFAVFARFSLGANKQRRLVSLLTDLAGRNGLGVADYLDDSEIQAILDQPHLNGPQHLSLLLQLLQERQTPSLASAEKVFRKWVNTLGLPEHCQVEHSQSFEKDDVSLAIRFNNRRDLADFVDTMRLAQRERERI